MSINDDYSPVSAISTGLRGRCPRCGFGKLFKGFLKIAPACNRCGLDYAFADSGDGPAVFVGLVAGTLGVGFALYVDTVYQPSIWFHILVSLPLTALICLAVLRPMKGVLIALQYQNKAEQGHFE